MSSTSFQNGILETPISLQDGGTGVSLADPNNDRILFWDDSAGELTWLTVGSGLSLVGTTLTASGGGTGTVTSVSVVSANGFAGSVATATTTPAITLSTTITGLLKGNGTAISAAVSGTDYAPATSGTSILKGNGSGGFSNASAGTDYEVPLTFSTGLTRTVNTVTVNTTQNIAKLSNLTTNGFVKTSGGDGTLSIDTNTYITGNQTITLSGDITGSGTTGITTAIAPLVIVDGDINASAAITLSKLAALTVSRALVSDGSGVISVSSVTSTELGYLSGVTSAIQTQLNAKQASGNYITALTGDVTASGPGSVTATLANTAVTPGSYTSANITVDSKGRITAAANGSGGSGVTTMAAIGATPNANGASISGSTLTLQPASASFGGVLTTGSQTIAGIKTFNEGGIAVGGSGTIIGSVSATDSFSAADTLITTSTAGVSLLGATNTSFAVVSNTAYDGLSANDSYARVILGNTTEVTEAGSGTHPFIGQLAIKPLVITSGAGATTNASTLYIEGAATGTATPTNNYAVWVDGGTVRIDGTIELGAASDTTISRSAAGVLAVEGVRVITDNSTTSGKILKNNGTTFVASTETYAAPGTSGNVMTSDGTNWTSAAPAGGGSFSYKTGGTSAAANNISITSLDLDTDTKYKIFVKYYIGSLSTGTDIEMTFNTDAASGNYGYAFNGYGRNSDANAAYVGAGESVNGIKLCDAFGMGSFELTIWQETDGSNESKIVMGNGWLSRPFNTGQARETTTVNNSGNWQDGANVTSIQFDITGSSDTANWEYRVYKIVNS